MYLVSSAVFIKSVNHIFTVMKYNSNHDMYFCHDYHGPTKVLFSYILVAITIACKCSNNALYYYSMTEIWDINV